MQEDKRLDRLVQFDERSRNFPIRAIVPTKPRSYTWKVNAYLDQGVEGACVGFAWAHELAARPKAKLDITNEVAREIYRGAQKIDEWEGEDYEGTSVIAGAKIVQRSGLIGEYRWAFGVEDLRLAVGYKGPAVIGVNWYVGMYDPDANGYVRPTGGIMGGHSLLVYGNDEKNKRFKLHNSWGPSWGNFSSCFISHDDMAYLLNQQGEACIPVKRY